MNKIIVTTAQSLQMAAAMLQASPAYKMETSIRQMEIVDHRRNRVFIANQD